jgi:S1-C subfamily serine protease
VVEPERTRVGRDPAEEGGCAGDSPEYEFLHALVTFRGRGRASTVPQGDLPVNASVHLLRRVAPTTVHLQANVPPEHPSTSILGSERSGTGTVIDPAGIVLTAHYIVIGAERIEVTLLDGSRVAGTLLGVDFGSGLALVKIATSEVYALPVRPVEDVRLGEDVFIVASVDDGRRVNDGVVSSIGPFEAFWEYMLDQAITTTASSPGLGGGPVVDTLGNMVGVVSLSLAEIGKFTLAIPASSYLTLRDDLLAGRVGATSLARAWIGLTCYTLRDHVVIAGLLPGSPGEHAGLKPGDVILSLDGVAVPDRRTLYTQLWSRKAGARVNLRVFRDSQVHEVSLVAGSMEEFFA